MPLFQKSVINAALKRLDDKEIEKTYKKFTNYFHNPEIQQNIRESKEEQFQEGFLRELFVKIFGYTLNPSPNYNLTTEFKNEKGAKKADGAILKDGKAIAVIELKGTKTKDLEKVRQQAFDYKANQTACVYVMTANFEKLRFYIENAVEFEEFDLFTITLERFKLLYLCLDQSKLLNNEPLKIKESSIREEEDITKKFYSDYSNFKRELFRDLVKLNMKNEVFRAELSREDSERVNKNIKQALFKKSQKLIDRFLFIFFAEDRDLLPPNSTIKILEQWDKLKELDEVVPLYSRFKKYFSYLDQGRKGTNHSAEIFAYNGGLFKPDQILDSLEISDELLYKHSKALSNYDFESQVDVNILGHIFENSLNEIESVNAEIEGVEFEKQKTKRKKDGVFYTPKYITKYIVDNTVGKLCEEKKNELKLVEEEYNKSRKGRTKKKLQELTDILDAYRSWLLNITICDPACGSGAFLNQALDFLIKEHTYIDELQTSLLGGGFLFPNIENTILENNIFGVDINEESVEIAKLSLWLRTAQPRRKLNDLNNNIKCGNSLIDSKAVAGDKAFKWEEQFSEIFAKGGFDVVIGNPPYVRQELLGSSQKEYYKQNYPSVYNGIADLYVYFYNKSIQILKQKGLLGFITPNKWTERKYGVDLRNYMKQFEILLIVNYGELKIFEDASTEPLIIICSNCISENKIKFTSIKNLKSAKSLDYNFEEFDKKTLTQDIWKFTDPKKTSILNKFKSIKNSTTLKDYTKGGGVYYGVKSGYTDAFIIKKELKDKLVENHESANELIEKVVEGNDFEKWTLKFDERYMIGTFPARNINIENYPSIKHHLEGFLPKLKQTGENYKDADGVIKKTRKKSNNKWFETQDVIDYHKLFLKPKLIYYHTAVNHSFYFDIEGYYLTANCYFISNADRYLQCLLNSSLFSFVKKFLFPAFGDSENGGRVRLDANKMNKLPIKLPAQNTLSYFQDYSNLLTRLSKNKSIKVNQFLSFIISKEKHISISNKLKNWFELDFQTFIVELNKRLKLSGKVKLTKLEEIEWMELFETKKAEVQAIKAEIDRTDKEINHLVYELYGLTKEEIEIVENS